jgi:hypothetical protein
MKIKNPPKGTELLNNLLFGPTSEFSVGGAGLGFARRFDGAKSGGGVALHLNDMDCLIGAHPAIDQLDKLFGLAAGIEIKVAIWIDRIRAAHICHPSGLVAIYIACLKNTFVHDFLLLAFNPTSGAYCSLEFEPHNFGGSFRLAKFNFTVNDLSGFGDCGFRNDDRFSDSGSSRNCLTAGSASDHDARLDHLSAKLFIGQAVVLVLLCVPDHFLCVCHLIISLIVYSIYPIVRFVKGNMRPVFINK